MACCLDITEKVLKAAEYGVDLKADRKLQIMKNGGRFYVYDLNREKMIDEILSELEKGNQSAT